MVARAQTNAGTIDVRRGPARQIANRIVDRLTSHAGLLAIPRAWQNAIPAAFRMVERRPTLGAVRPNFPPRPRESTCRADLEQELSQLPCNRAASTFRA